MSDVKTDGCGASPSFLWGPALSLGERLNARKPTFQRDYKIAIGRSNLNAFDLS